jgi:hypothetical protein
MSDSEDGNSRLAALYKQINAPVGQLSIDSVTFATKAMLSTSTGDQTYTNADATIAGWTTRRDALADRMIRLLDRTGPRSGGESEGDSGNLIRQAQSLLAEVHAAAVA